MSLVSKATFGNVVEVQGNYRPQSAAPSFSFKSLVAKFLKRRTTTTTATTPPPAPATLQQQTPQRQRTLDAVTEPAPILQFRPKSIYEVLNQGDGTKFGENDADGVGLPTGNGGGDMEGIIIRDFADKVEGEGEEGEREVVDEYDEVGVEVNADDEFGRALQMGKE